MKNLSFFKFAFLVGIILSFSFISNAQNSADIINENPPENLYVVPIALATWDPIINDDFQSYKIWLDNAFIADVDTNFFQFNEDDLVSGETYFAEVQALYNSGLSEKIGFEFEFFPSDSFPGFGMLNGINLPGTDDVLLTWSEVLPIELIPVTQNPGAPLSANIQNFGFGYGVVYDFSLYPDALINSVEFHHTSWDVIDTWDYLIHIYDWDTKTIISTIGPLQTTGDDLWEMGIELGDVTTGGATNVAILLEPLSNEPNNAYPILSSDNASDPQGSIYGDLSDVSTITSSTTGNFLMNTWIYTSNAGGKEANEQISIGANIYFDYECIAFVPEPDTSYIIEDVGAGFYDYCVTKVYTEDDGAHTWTSCLYENCIQDAGYPEQCYTPQLPTATRLDNDPNIVKLEWVQGQYQFSEWLHYDVTMSLGGFPPLNTDYTMQWAIKFLPEDLEPYNIGYISKIANFIYEPQTDYVTEVRIYTGDGTNLIYSQDITGTLVEDGWNETVLNEDVPFSNTDTLWISMYADRPANAGGISLFSVEEVLIDRYDYYAFNGSDWTTLNENYGIQDVTWPLRAFASTTPSGKSAELSNSKNTKEFLGYNIWRDGELINSDYITETTYYDTISNEYRCYEITEARSSCQSDPSVEVCVDIIWAVEELKNNLVIYPNPAKDFLIIESSNIIKSVIITNYMGQVISSTKAIELTKTHIETSKLSTGVYILDVETEAGIEKAKIIISK